MSNAIGSRIRHLRYIRGLSAARLGRQIGVSKTMIYRYERGSVPSLRTQVDIAHALGVQVRHLWDGMTLDDTVELIRRGNRMRVHSPRVRGAMQDNLSVANRCTRGGAPHRANMKAV